MEAIGLFGDPWGLLGMATMVHGVTVKVLSGLRGLSNGGLMVSYNSYIMLYMYIYIYIQQKSGGIFDTHLFGCVVRKATVINCKHQNLDEKTDATSSCDFHQRLPSRTAVSMHGDMAMCRESSLLVPKTSPCLIKLPSKRGESTMKSGIQSIHDSWLMVGGVLAWLL